MALENKIIRDQMDIKIFVQTDSDICFIRRLERDTKQRGRTQSQVVAQYLKTVKPMQEQFIEPSKYFADFIIPNQYRNSVAVEMVINNLKYYLEH